MPKSLMQTPQWAQFKEKNGWQPNTIADTSVLFHKLSLGMNMAYAPEVSQKNWINWLPQFTVDIKNLAQEKKLMFARLEILEPISSQPIIENLKKLGFAKSFEEVQPEHRQIVKIDIPDDEILAQMKPKGRYNIKVAQRENVNVSISSDPQKIPEFARLFSNLFSQTAKRNRFALRPILYFENLLKMLFENDLGVFVTAVWQNQPLCALIVSFYDGVASYLYGASANENRHVMAPYLAHWQAIQEAKARGCRAYDLLNIAPPDAPETHRHAGITRFKQQFGGESIELIGSWDLIFKPLWYTIYRRAEKSRRRL